MSASGAIDVAPEIRDRLRTFSDALIPAAHGMPAASEVGVADGQLDRVVRARPDLLEPMTQALASADPLDIDGSLARIQAADPVAYEALLMTIVGGYYTHPDIRTRLDYDGQQPVEVRAEIIPNYVEEGLIDPVLERGAIYRPIPAQEDVA